MSDEFAGAMCTGVLCFAPAVVIAAMAWRSASRTEKELSVQRDMIRDLQAELTALRLARPATAGAVSQNVKDSSSAPVPGAPDERPATDAASAAPTIGALPTVAAATEASAAPTEAPGAPRPRPRPGAASSTPPSSTPPSATPPPVRPPPPPSTPVDTAKLIERGAVWFFAAAGGLLAVVAVLFGLREAVAAGWVGPAARFALGVAVGVGSFAIGEALRARRYRVPADALFAVGAGASYASIYAGYARYGLYGQPTTFAALVGIAAATLFVAARRGSRFGTYLAAAGAWLVPLLLSTGENRPIAFFSYVALVDLALLAIARRRRWFDPVVVSAGVTAILYLGWVAAFRAPDQVLIGLAAATALGALHAVVPGRQGAAGTVASVAGIALWLLGVLAFATPTDPLATDPRSFLPLPMPLGLTAWYGVGALGVGVLGFGAWVRGRIVGEGFLALSAGLATLAFAIGWSVVDSPQTWPVAVVVLAVPVLALLTTTSLPAVGLVPLSGAAVFFAALVAPPAAPALFVITTGLASLAAGVGWTRGPRWLLPAGVIAAALPLYPGLGVRLGAGESTWLLGAASLIYAVSAWPPFLRPRAKDLAGTLAAMLTNALLFWPFYSLWITTLGDDHVGALALVFAASMLLGAAAVARVAKARADDRELALLVTGVLFFVSLAVPLELRNAWLTVGWALEVVALGFLSRRLTHWSIRAFGVVLAAAVAVRLLINPEALAYGDGSGAFLFNWTLYTWGVPLVCFIVAARVYREPKWFPGALAAGAVFLGFALVNLEIAHAFARDAQLSFESENLGEGMTRSISWALYGLFLIVLGVWKDRRALRFFGLSFAVLGAGKVFLVDLWSLSGFARVGALAGVAVTLLLAAVAFQRLVLRERSS